jgi:hypothetical protein
MMGMRLKREHLVALHEEREGFSMPNPNRIPIPKLHDDPDFLQVRNTGTVHYMNHLWTSSVPWKPTPSLMKVRWRR